MQPRPGSHTAASAMMDPFERTIDYLRISVTDRCDLKCIYCTPREGVRRAAPADLLNSNEILSVVRAAGLEGVRKVRITGGEPLLRPDILLLIARIKHEAGIRDVSLTTNGIHLADMARVLKERGLDRVNISLDTTDRERYRMITRGGQIQKVWDSIAAAEDAGLYPVKINVVVMRGVNDDEIERFALMTRDRDCHVRFIEYMPLSKVWDRDRCVTAAEILARVSGLGPLAPLEYRGGGPSRNYRLAGAQGVIGVISPVSDHFCGFCNRLRLTATGMLKPCLFHPGGIDVRTRIRAGATDAELGLLLRQAARVKPQEHRLGSGAIPSGKPIAMVQIGG